MEISKILSADVLDIIFEGKNKEYGAYDLRKTYARRLSLSISVMVALVLLLWAGFVLGKNDHVYDTRTIEIPPTEITSIEPPLEEKELPPPPKKIEQPQAMEKKHTKILIVKEQDIKMNDIPLNDDLVNAKISVVNKDGVKYNDIAGPMEKSHNKGIIELPKKHNTDSVFLTVQIESSYPGGPAAWLRFLNKNLGNNYPANAVEKGIQGRVVIRFIVDVDGSLSNITAAEGPAELKDAAISVIRKSGKWNPAIQNGQKVKSWKSQPIVFQLDDQ
jgi:protein TonB